MFNQLKSNKMEKTTKNPNDKFVEIAKKNYKALLDFQVKALKPELFKDQEACDLVWKCYTQLRYTIYGNDREFFNDEEGK